MLALISFRMRRLRIFVLVAAALMAGKCGSSDKSPTIPSSSSGGSPVVTAHGSMSATLDGVRWDATILTVKHQNGSITVTALDSSAINNTEVDFTTPDSVGSHAVATTGLTFASVTVTILPTVSPWSSAKGGSNGTITVTSSTSTGAAGTFAFNLPAFETPATGTKVVTNGVFNLTY